MASLEKNSKRWENNYCWKYSLEAIIKWLLLYFLNHDKGLLLPTVCYFSREKPLVKPTAPGSLLYYICLCDLFLFAFIFRSIKPKIQKYLAAIYSYLFYLAFPRSNLSYFYHVHLPISGAVTRKGLTTPLIRRVASICYLCAGAVHVVLRGSPTGPITLVSSLREIPTIAVLHHAFLFGEIPT